MKRLPTAVVDNLLGELSSDLAGLRSLLELAHNTVPIGRENIRTGEALHGCAVLVEAIAAKVEGFNPKAGK